MRRLQSRSVEKKRVNGAGRSVTARQARSQSFKGNKSRAARRQATTRQLNRRHTKATAPKEINITFRGRSEYAKGLVFTKRKEPVKGMMAIPEGNQRVKSKSAAAGSHQE